MDDYPDWVAEITEDWRCRICGRKVRRHWSRHVLNDQRKIRLSLKRFNQSKGVQ